MKVTTQVFALRLDVFLFRKGQSQFVIVFYNKKEIPLKNIKENNRKILNLK